MYQFNATIPIILASTSPRRRELLDQVALPHTCAAVNIDETRLAEESAIDYIGRMVSQKAQAALQVLPTAMTECVVITADTIGVLPDGVVLQKPNDFADACAMWRQMSNASHQVWTAVQVSRLVQRDGQWHNPSAIDRHAAPFGSLALPSILGARHCSFAATSHKRLQNR